MTDEKIGELIKLYEDNEFAINRFLKRVVDFFQNCPKFYSEKTPSIHSVKWRMKNKEHLAEKIRRKDDGNLTRENFFDRITDLAGVRIMHIYSAQVEIIHRAIMQEVEEGEWFLYENPTAYTWDIDLTKFYESLGIETKVKSSYYTSIHYVVMPKEISNIKCEIQVRTLFEEAWGEIDHSLNYPSLCDDKRRREEIKTLAQLSAAGIRLANLIMNSEEKEQ